MKVCLQSLKGLGILMQLCIRHASRTVKNMNRRNGRQENRSEAQVELGKIIFGNDTVSLYLESYASFAKSRVPAISVVCIKDGMAWPYGMLTVNLSPQGVELEPWQLSIKDWGENGALAQACLASGLFRPMPEKLPLAFGAAPVWHLAAERMPVQVAQEAARLMDWTPTGHQLVELAARSRAPQGGIINLNVEGLCVAVCLDEKADALAMRALWFDGAASRDLVELEPAEVEDAIRSLRFDLAIADVGRIFNGLQTGLSLAERTALVDPALQALMALDMVSERPGEILHQAAGLDTPAAGVRERSGA